MIFNLVASTSFCMQIDDLAIVAESLEEVKNKMSIWKLKYAENSLKLNVLRTKALVNGRGVSTIKELGKFPCSLCLKGIRVNSVYYSSCKHWEKEVKNRLSIWKLKYA